MKPLLFISFLFILTHFAFSQNGTDLSFAPLLVVDTLSDTALIAKHQLEPELEGDNFFVNDWMDTKSTLQKALFCKQGKRWVVYQLPNDGSRYNNFSVSDGNRFITCTKEGIQHNKKQNEVTTYWCIIDVANRSFLPVVRLLVTEISVKNNPTIRSGCESSYELKGNWVTIRTVVSKNTDYQQYFQTDCLPTGAYQITDGKLKKLVLEK